MLRYPRVREPGRAGGAGGILEGQPAAADSRATPRWGMAGHPGG